MQHSKQLKIDFPEQYDLLNKKNLWDIKIASNIVNF